MKININSQTFFKYFLLILGFIIVSFYIWFRFLRERLPREIPFSLNWISFLLLSSVCIIYVYIILKILQEKLLQRKYARHRYLFEFLLKKNNKHSFLSTFILNKLIFILNQIKILFTPLIVLHNFLMIELNFQSYCIKVFIYFNYKYRLYNTAQNKKALLLLDFSPKIIILLLFLLDVFYFKKLNLFYYSLFLGIIPLMYSYFIYICTNYLEMLIKDLESNYYVKILTTKEEEEVYEKHLEDTRGGGGAFMVSLNSLQYADDDFDILNTRYFIKIQALNLMFDYYLYKYACVETGHARRVYAKKHQIKLPGLRLMEPEEDYISKQLAPYFYENIEIAIYLETFKEIYEDITRPTIKENHLFYIFIGYLLAWTYILLLSSINSISLEDINNIVELLKTMKINKEPFSELDIE